MFVAWLLKRLSNACRCRAFQGSLCRGSLSSQRHLQSTSGTFDSCLLCVPATRKVYLRDVCILIVWHHCKSQMYFRNICILIAWHHCNSQSVSQRHLYLDCVTSLTPFPPNSLGWKYKLRSSLCTHVFHQTDSKDPDIHVLYGWMPATKTHPACLYGWIIMVTYAKSHQKWWNPEM